MTAIGPGPGLALQVLVGRYDRTAFEPDGKHARVRSAVAGGDAWDALLERGAARLERAGGDADATLTADSKTWAAIADDVDDGMRAFRSGRLAVPRNLHIGVGFLAATSGVSGPGRLRFRTVVTRRARLSTLEAGVGPPVLAIHGLGATKGSFVFTVAALADRFRVNSLGGPSRWRSPYEIPSSSVAWHCSRPRWPGDGPSVGTSAAACETGAGLGPARPTRHRAGGRSPTHPGRRSRMDGGGRRRVPARLSHARWARRVLCGCAPDLPRSSHGKDGF